MNVTPRALVLLLTSTPCSMPSILRHWTSVTFSNILFLPTFLLKQVSTNFNEKISGAHFSLFFPNKKKSEWKTCRCLSLSSFNLHSFRPAFLLLRPSFFSSLSLLLPPLYLSRYSSPINLTWFFSVHWNCFFIDSNAQVLVRERDGGEGERKRIFFPWHYFVK